MQSDALCLSPVSVCTEKLIEGLKSPDASLMLPDLLSMSDPFGSSVEDIKDGNVHTHTHTHNTMQTVVCLNKMYA